MGNPKIERRNLDELIHLQKEFNRYNYNQICNFRRETFAQIFFKRACTAIHFFSFNDNFYTLCKFFTSSDR